MRTARHWPSRSIAARSRRPTAWCGETTVPSWLMFHNAFDLSRVGFAASIAVVLTVIITGVALLLGSLSRRTA